MSEQLLPCPFCGGEAFCREDINASHEKFQVECQCGVRGEKEWESEHAIEAWNRREPQPSEAVEALKQIGTDRALDEIARAALTESQTND